MEPATTAALLTGGASLLSGLFGSRSAKKAQKQQAAALATQADVAARQQQLAEEQYRRYMELYAPIEEQYAYEALRPVPYEALAGRAEGVVGREYDTQRDALMRQMARYGVSPGSGRGMALQQDMSLSEAAARAHAANQERREAQAAQQALMGNLVNIGRGMPAQTQNALSSVGTAYGGLGNVYEQQAANIAAQTQQNVGGLWKLYGYGNQQGWFDRAQPQPQQQQQAALPWGAVNTWAGTHPERQPSDWAGSMIF